MADRRDLEEKAAKAAPGRKQPGESTPESDNLLALQRRAGNKAVAELVAAQRAQQPATTPAMRIRDSLRAGRGAGQPEFGLRVQRAPTAVLKEPGRLLRQGSRGADVAALQQLLGVPADGIFGPITRAAVVNFQNAAGLTSDGIVGPVTWSALASGKVGATGKLPEETFKGVPIESTDKLPEEETIKGMPLGSTDKIPEEETIKGMPLGSTDKLPPEWEDETGKS